MKEKSYIEDYIQRFLVNSKYLMAVALGKVTVSDTIVDGTQVPDVCLDLFSSDFRATRNDTAPQTSKP